MSCEQAAVVVVPLVALAGAIGLIVWTNHKLSHDRAALEERRLQHEAEILERRRALNAELDAKLAKLHNEPRPEMTPESLQQLHDETAKPWPPPEEP